GRERKLAGEASLVRIPELVRRVAGDLGPELLIARSLFAQIVDGVPRSILAQEDEPYGGDSAEENQIERPLDERLDAGLVLHLLPVGPYGGCDYEGEQDIGLRRPDNDSSQRDESAAREEARRKKARDPEEHPSQAGDGDRLFEDAGSPEYDG